MSQTVGESSVEVAGQAGSCRVNAWETPIEKGLFCSLPRLSFLPYRVVVGGSWSFQCKPQSCLMGSQLGSVKGQQSVHKEHKDILGDILNGDYFLLNTIRKGRNLCMSLLGWRARTLPKGHKTP